MDEFTKTKIGFTVALLATVFAFKPVIDIYGGYGFIFLEKQLTVNTIFLTSIALLGFATYCMSLQFISNKQIPFLEKISHLTYALSLILPLVFFIFWAFILLKPLLAFIPALPPIKPQTWSAIGGFLAGLITIITTVQTATSLKEKDIQSKSEYFRKKELDLLARAENLVRDGHYDLALLESFKIIELTLKQALEFRSHDVRNHNIFELIERVYKLELISNSEMQNLQNLRRFRNSAAHKQTNISKEQATEAIEAAKTLIRKLSFETNMFGYHWLKENHLEAINALSGENNTLLDLTKSSLWDAWIKRDGVISIEISIFFELALVRDPKSIVEMFSKNKRELQSWLEELQYSMFTDWDGTQENELKALKEEISLSLENYIAGEKNEKNKKTAKLMKQKIDSIEIRKID